jgi:hypothetical protein
MLPFLAIFCDPNGNILPNLVPLMEGPKDAQQKPLLKH